MIQPLHSVRLSDDGTILYVKDVTGNYSSTNPGGWGSPNWEKASNPDLLFEIVAQDGGRHYYYPIKTSSGVAYTQYMMGSEIAIPAVDVGYTDRYPSGQIQVSTIFMFHVSNPPPVAVLVTSLSNQISVVSGTLDSIMLPDGGVIYPNSVSTPGGLVSPMYLIDKTKPIGATATLLQEIPSSIPSGGTNAYPTIITRNNSLWNNIGIDDCVAAAIGRIGGDPNACDQDIDRAVFMTMQKFAIDIQTQAGNYQAAAEIRSLLVGLCTPNCGCP